jgi:hypothetical protein
LTEPYDVAMASCRRVARAALIGSVSALAACSGGAARGPAEPIGVPTRSSAEDPVVRRLLTDLAAKKLCDEVRGDLLSMPADGSPRGPQIGKAPSVGRMWITECRSELHDNRIEISLGGDGWRFIAYRTEKAGAVFTVSDYVPFRFEIDITAEIDVSYSRERRVLSFWLTPVRPIQATLTPLRAPRVEPEGAWSQLLGSLGGVFGHSPEKTARKAMASEGALGMQRELQSGFTVTLDLCTSQRDVVPVALGNGVTAERPVEARGRQWQDNERVRLQPGGFDADGPYETEGRMRVDMEIERGAAVRARLMCEEDARRVITSYMNGKPEPAAEPLAEAVVKPHTSVTLEPRRANCPMVLVTRLARDAKQSTELQYIVHEVGKRQEALVSCQPRRGRAQR